MKKAMSILFILGIVAMVCVPFVIAIQTDKVYVGTTGAIGGYNTMDYGAKKWGDYIVWIRALDIYDASGNVNPDGNVVSAGGLHDPSWIMIQRVSTGEIWNITPDYYAGKRLTSPKDYYYHADAISIYENHVIYEWIFGTLNYERTLYMYNITQNETWQIPHGTLSTYTSGYEHIIYDDWIYFSHWGGGGKLLYIYNYETTEGRRIDHGYLSNSNIGMNDEFCWFTETTGHPNDLKMYSLTTDGLVNITGINVGYSIYGSWKSSRDGWLGIHVNTGTDYNSYLINLDGMNVTSYDGDITIYWEDIADENIIEVDVDGTYWSYAPITDGNYAVYNIWRLGDDNDILIYDIDNDETTLFLNTSADEELNDYYNTVILYSTNQNSFIKYNNARDDYDIYRTSSDCEYIGESITNIIPFVIIIMIIGVILGAFAMFGASAGDGGML